MIYTIEVNHVKRTIDVDGDIPLLWGGAREHLSETERAIARSRYTLKGIIWLLRGARESANR
jgi:hypothetical protein